MNIIWLGHSSFRIEIEDQILLLDPWLTDNPMFPEERRAEVLADATHILLTHAHGDHSGGTVKLGKVAVTMVNAVHSSSLGGKNGPVYAGTEAGFMISGEGHTIYVSGDTDIMADMDWMGDLHAPDIGILCAGGHFTMDMQRAAYAAKRYFNFKTVIPCHYRTFPRLEQSAAALADGLPGVQVIEPEVLIPITL